jgi:signal transduction histidine kinase
MLILQLISGIAIFLMHALNGPFPLETAFAALLAYLVLVLSGFAFPKPQPRLPIIALKCAYCLALWRYGALTLLLIPVLILEAPALLPARKRFAPLWALLALLAAAPFPFLERGDYPFFILLWAGSVFCAANELKAKALSARTKARALELEKSLAETESRRDALERASAGLELLAKLEERDRIAQRLHDDLGHAMTGSIMQLEAASLLIREEPERAEKLVGKAAQALREGLSSVRSSLKAIKPSAAALGLGKIAAMLEAFEADHGIAASLSAEGAVDALPAPVWLAVEANLREALINTLKHSGGRRFQCRVSSLNRMYKVEFRDDGTAGSAFRKGMGIEGMEARTREAGGTLIVDASRGFSIIMLFMKGENQDGDPDHHRG